MRTVRTIDELRATLRGLGAALRPTAPAGGATVGMVPTMGALHDGHLSLVRAAREECDLVVVSVFVNPTQFTEQADLVAYPRDEAQDAALVRSAGADLLFAPGVAEVYPPGHATVVRVHGVSAPLEGAKRGVEHFDGVATVVTKLLIAALPDIAYFGQKDAQQVAVVRRLVTDLRLPVVVRACPTVREPDGLAMSSRNVRLTPAQRPQALALKAGLDAVTAAYRAGAAPRTAEHRGREVMEDLGVSPEYLDLVDPETFAPIERRGQDALVVVAARVGAVRLIDNQPIPTP